jgi:hypothetical protein
MPTTAPGAHRRAPQVSRRWATFSTLILSTSAPVFKVLLEHVTRQDESISSEFSLSPPCNPRLCQQQRHRYWHPAVSLSRLGPRCLCRRAHQQEEACGTKLNHEWRHARAPPQSVHNSEYTRIPREHFVPGTSSWTCLHCLLGLPYAATVYISAATHTIPCYSLILLHTR